jgi:hypothetical protein
MAYPPALSGGGPGSALLAFAACVLVLDGGEIQVFRAHVMEGPAEGAEEDREA